MKVILSISTAFFIVFFLLFLITSDYLPAEIRTLFLPSSKISDLEKEFFFQNQNSSKKIFLIGSSHMGHVNASSITLTIQDSLDNFVVYNLARVTDFPERRINSIDSIILNNPSLVIYGISYRDFQVPVDGSVISKNLFLLPDPKTEIGDALKYHGYETPTINPQLISKTFLKNLFSPELINSDIDQIVLSGKDIHLRNTPFYVLPSHHVFIEYDEVILSNQDRLTNTWNDPIYTKNNYNAFEEIIKKLQHNNIEIVVVSMPLSKYLIEKLNDNQKLEFENYLKYLQQNYQIEIYDLSTKYADLKIWTNTDHVAVNDKISIFNDDIAKIILKEM